MLGASAIPLIGKLPAAVVGLLAVLMFCVGGAFAQTDNRSMLVGTWENSMEAVDDNVPVITEITYADDGRYSGIRRTKMGEIFRTEVIEGSWVVDEISAFDFTLVRQPDEGGEVEVEYLEWQDDGDMLLGDEETALYQRVYGLPDDSDDPAEPEG